MGCDGGRDFSSGGLSHWLISGIIQLRNRPTALKKHLQLRFPVAVAVAAVSAGIAAHTRTATDHSTVPHRILNSSHNYYSGLRQASNMPAPAPAPARLRDPVPNRRPLQHQVSPVL
jgi:hypothetical protein